MAHPAKVVEKSGTPPSGARCITVAKLDALKSKVRDYATALAVSDSYKDHDEVLAQLQQQGLVGKALISNFTVSVTKEI